MYVFPADEAGCGAYRMAWPAQALRAQGHDVRVVPPKARHGIGGDIDSRTGTLVDVRIPPDADVIVMQRVSLAHLASAIPMIRAKGVAVVVDMDDDLTKIDPNNPAFWAMRADSGDRRHTWRNAHRACLDATLVTVSTPALLPVYAPHGRGVVIENRIPARYLQVPHVDSAAVGWAGSTHSHPFDLHEVGPAVARLVREGHTYRGVGPEIGLRDALGLDADPEVTGSVDLEQWADAVATMGIAMVPLADTGFNSAKCLDAETRIATERGLIRIGDVRVGDRVWHQDRWRDVQAVSAEPASPGLKITTSAGRELRLTQNHRLYQNDIWNAGWTRAKDLQVGDSLAMTPDLVAASTLQRAPWPSDGRASRGQHDRQAFLSSEDVPTVEITPRWGRFLGLFAGDGCASGTAVIMSVDGQDADLIELITDDLTAMGFWPYTQQSRTWGGELLRRRSVAVSSAHLIRFLRGLGVVEADTVRRIISVPEVIWRSPREVVASFLSGLFEADGTISSSGVSMTTKYRRFALQVQRLLVAFGIESTVAERWNRAKPGGRKFQSFIVSLRRAASDVFAKEIGFLSARKVASLVKVTSKPHSNAYRPMRWQDTIISIEPCWLEPVDIQVDGEAFAAAGFVSHNSWLKGLEASACGVPWVASPRAEYVRLQKALGVGFLARKPKDWYRMLKRLATDDALRLEQSAAGRAAAAEWTIEGNAWRWLEAWDTARQAQLHMQMTRV